MPQLEYVSVVDLPDLVSSRLYTDTCGRRWHLVAVLIHHDRDGEVEMGRTAFLRRESGGGQEWEVPFAELPDNDGTADDEDSTDDIHGAPDTDHSGAEGDGGRAGRRSRTAGGPGARRDQPPIRTRKPTGRRTRVR